MARKRKLVAKVSPSRPEARDIGPRLIQLQGADQRTPLDRYFELADVALGCEKPEKRTRDDKPR